MTTTSTTRPSRPSAPRGGGAPDRGTRRPPRGKTLADRPKDVDQKILEIRRVTRVVAGGRRMSFAVSMIIGDKNLGVVGVGTGKGNDTALAIAKALKDAKKNAIRIKRTDTQSIPYSVAAKYNASRVMLFPNGGKGLVAGAAIRDIAVMAGLKDISGKVVSGSKNKLNTARATIVALSEVATPYIFGVRAPEQTPAEAPAQSEAVKAEAPAA